MEESIELSAMLNKKVIGDTSRTSQGNDITQDVARLDEISEETKSEVDGLGNFGQNDVGADNWHSTDELIAEQLRVEEEKKADLEESNMHLVEQEEITPNKIYSGDAFLSEEVFNSEYEAIQWITSIAQNVGMVLVRSRSDFSDGRSPYVKYACERGGKMRVQYVKKVGGVGKGKPRTTFSKKCECPFLLLLRNEKKVGGWCVTVKNGFHNHSLNNSDLGHSFKGRLKKDDKELVHTLTNSGTAPKYIQRALKDKNPLNSTSLQTIYNERVKLKKKERDNRTVIQDVFHQARKHDVFLRFTKEGEMVTNVFWIPNNSLLLVKNFPHVFLMDCTYKTNKYKFPLLQIVGVSSTNITFSIAFAYLGSETTDTFVWALRKLQEGLITINTPVRVIVTDKDQALMSAIRIVFPMAKNLLCQWHVEKAVSAKFRQSVSEDVADDLEMIWKRIMYSDTEDQFLVGVDEIKTKVDGDLFDYLKTNWLGDCKEQFVNVWTNKVFHLGNTHNGKVEGAHSALKNWLGTANCDMATGWNSVAKLCDRQYQNIVASFEISKTKWPVKIYGEQWCRYLRGVVSLHGLSLIQKELDRSKEVGIDPIRCGCVVRQTHEIPCAHEISKIFGTRDSLPRSCVNNHWKTLSLEGPSNDEVIDPTPQIEAFRELFENSTVTQKMELVQRLREIVEPSATMLRQPTVKINPRGRPKGSVARKKANDERSTKRQPSLFEHVAESKKKETTVKRKFHAKESKPVKRANILGNTSNDVVCGDPLKVVGAPTSRDSEGYSFFKIIPDPFKEFVDRIINVKGDGNCGYRAVAVSLGLPEDEWPKIRQDLFHELKENVAHYDNLFKNNGMSDELLKGIDFKGKGKCSPEFWMKTTAMNWVISEKYSAAVTLFHPNSKGNTVICFPTKKKPETPYPLNITLLKTTDHYMCVFLKDDCPLPPLINHWKEEALKVSEDVCNAWLQLFGERINKGVSLMYPYGQLAPHIEIAE